MSRFMAVSIGLSLVVPCRAESLRVKAAGEAPSAGKPVLKDFLNDRGQIAGMADTPRRGTPPFPLGPGARHARSGSRQLRHLLLHSPRYYVWDPNRGRAPLDKYFSLAPGKFYKLTSFNNRGCITMYALTPADTRGYSVLLEPCP